MANAEHLAKEADRLRNDPIFLKALSDIRADTLNTLATANAGDHLSILRLQQRVAAIQEIHDILDRYVYAAPERVTTDEKSPFA